MSLSELSQKITKPIALKHKHPIFYIERSKVYVSENAVTVANKERKTSIPVADIGCIVLGPGTSITNEAVKIIARRDTNILWAGGGGMPVHCFSGNYRSPQNLLAQAALISNETERLKAGKWLLEKRNSFLTDDIEPIKLADIKSCKTMTELSLVEARWAKSFYKSIGEKTGLPISKTKVKLTNFFCYGLVTSIMISMGFSPNIGVMHGANRGGGLLFDMADLIKPVLSVKLAAEATKLNYEDNKIKHEIISRFDDGGYQQRIINVLVELYGLDS